MPKILGNGLANQAAEIGPSHRPGRCQGLRRLVRDPSHFSVASNPPFLVKQPRAARNGGLDAALEPDCRRSRLLDASDEAESVGK